MFGYILPEKPELKIREYEVFRAYYCGVCKSMGKRLGQITRAVLNYDCAFLGLLLDSISGEDQIIAFERCIAHPVKKRHAVKNSPFVDYAADMNVILAYYKLEDNKRDENSILSSSGMLMLRRSFRKLRGKYNEKCAIIEKRLGELSMLEAEKCSSMDRAAEPFAKLMEEVMEYGPFSENESTAKIIRWIGYNIGKWIYVLDAFDDVGADVKNKSYNPLLYQFEYGGEAIEEFKARIRERVEFNLTYSLNQIAKAYELLQPGKNSGILENIIYMGMLRKTENVIKVGSCKKS